MKVYWDIRQSVDTLLRKLSLVVRNLYVYADETAYMIKIHV